MSLKIGTFVKIRNRNGSIGIVIGNHVGCNYVEFNYGQDNYGESIKSTSNLIPDDNLVEITEAEYKEYTGHKAWTKEQRDVDDKIIDRLKGEFRDFNF